MPDLIRPLVCQAWYPASGSGPFFTLQTKEKKKKKKRTCLQMHPRYLNQTYYFILT